MFKTECLKITFCPSMIETAIFFGEFNFHIKKLYINAYVQLKLPLFLLIWLIQSVSQFRESSELSKCPKSSCYILHFAQVTTRASHTWTTLVTNGAFPGLGWATQSLGKLIPEKSRKHNIFQKINLKKKKKGIATCMQNCKRRSRARSWITNEMRSIFYSAEYRFDTT